MAARGARSRRPNACAKADIDQVAVTNRDVWVRVLISAGSAFRCHSPKQTSQHMRMISYGPAAAFGPERRPKTYRSRFGFDFNPRDRQMRRRCRNLNLRLAPLPLRATELLEAELLSGRSARTGLKRFRCCL
jgi:hypothetical protein